MAVNLSAVSLVNARFISLLLSLYKLSCRFLFETAGKGVVKEVKQNTGTGLSELDTDSK
jgi:hypothetical protein